MLLEKITRPEDVKKLSIQGKKRLAAEIRSFLTDAVSKTGGHLASNLGVVELTIALFSVFSPEKDRIVWDVGHQSYVHKLLSGRREAFKGLRSFKGMSGFPSPAESPCDAFGAGHSSTSISAGLGLVEGRDLLGQDYSVVSVIGDGALTGGMAFEALNNAARLKSNFIIILNDNNMSISENVGGLSGYLSIIRSGGGYNSLKERVADVLGGIPGIGSGLVDGISRTKNSIKQLFIPGMFFENMGITYLGPVDGHDTEALIRTIEAARRLNHAVLVHVITKKGKGYGPAEKNPEKFHGIGPFDIATGREKKKNGQSYTDVFSGALLSLAKKDESIVALTAAMPDGTGLGAFKKAFPDRFFDVGIAEQHAVTMAAGMAMSGLKPVVAVYSSFLQRGFDQILHDVCIQGLPVVFALDRAGLVGNDGKTHHGLFDLSYMGMIPGMTVMAPKNAWELEKELEFAFGLGQPAAVRYPRGAAYTGLSEFKTPVEYGRGEMLFSGKKAAILAVGSMVEEAVLVRELLLRQGIDISVANARFVKPMDTDLILSLAESHELLITMEENVFCGGFGQSVSAFLAERGSSCRVMNIAVPDTFVEHGDRQSLLTMLGMDAETLADRICDALREKRP